LVGRAGPCGRAARRRRITGSPQDRVPSRRGRDLPGAWAVLFGRAVVQHPAGPDPSSPQPLFEEIHGEAVVAFTQNRALGIRNDIAFEAATPRLARSRAYASPAPLPGPAQGSLPAWAGSPFAGRDSHPLDDKRSFMESSHPPFPFDQPCLVALVLLCAHRVCLDAWRAARRLEKAGRRMSDFGLAIAVHAPAYGLTLVTADRAFERLRLTRENWLA